MYLKIKYKIINNPTKISQDYERSIMIGDIIKDRKQIVLPGYGNGLVIKWEIRTKW